MCGTEQPKEQCGVERVLGDLVWCKVRYGSFLVAFYGIVLGLFGTVWHRLEWQHLTFSSVFGTLVAVSEQ